MKRAFKPLDYHAEHNIEVRASDKLQGQAYYHCVDCRKWVAWLSKQDTAQAREMGLLKTVENAPLHTSI